MDTIEISTKRRCELIDISGQVSRLIRSKKITSGTCVVFCPHTTAGLTINENADPSVRQDILNHLEELVPATGDYAHAEGNADAHIKASLLGSSLTIFIEAGEPVLGTWQGIYFCEFDGPRQRHVYVQIIEAPQCGLTRG